MRRAFVLPDNCGLWQVAVFDVGRHGTWEYSDYGLTKDKAQRQAKEFNYQEKINEKR